MKGAQAEITRGRAGWGSRASIRKPRLSAVYRLVPIGPFKSTVYLRRCALDGGQAAHNTNNGYFWGVQARDDAAEVPRSQAAVGGPLGYLRHARVMHSHLYEPLQLGHAALDVWV